jgi:hypothetical protein
MNRRGFVSALGMLGIGVPLWLRRDGASVNRKDPAELIRRIVTGELSVVALGASWDAVFAGNAEFVVSDGTLLRVFNDCDSVDYIDSIRWPDGDEWDYDRVNPRNAVGPLGAGRAEDSAIERVFKSAPVLTYARDVRF